MKIAYIIPSLYKKGPIIVVKEIVDGLIELGVCKEDIVVYYFDNSCGVEFPVTTKKIRFWNTISIKSKYDIIHSHMLRPDLFLLKEKIINKILLKKNNFYIISTIHQKIFENLYYETNKYLYSLLISKIWEMILSYFNKIVVLTESMKNYYRRKIFGSNRKYAIIFNGRTISEIRKIENKKKDRSRIYLGSACSLNKRKNIDKVIMAIKDLTEVEYFIIGDGPERYELEKLSIDLNIKNRIHFLGFKENVLDYFYLFNIFILPSRAEGMSLSLIEAAALKKTIICSRIDANLEMFNEQEAIFVQPDDINGIKDAIIEAAHNCQYSLAAYNKYVKEYTGIMMARRYYELYKELIINKNENI